MHKRTNVQADNQTFQSLLSGVVTFNLVSVIKVVHVSCYPSIIKKFLFRGREYPIVCLVHSQADGNFSLKYCQCQSIQVIPNIVTPVQVGCIAHNLHILINV